MRPTSPARPNSPAEPTAFHPRKLRTRDLALSRGAGMRKMPLEVQEVVQERRRRVWDFHAAGGEVRRHHLRRQVVQGALGLALIGSPICLLWFRGAFLLGIAAHLLVGAFLGAYTAWRTPGTYENGFMTLTAGFLAFLLSGYGLLWLPPFGPFAWLYYMCIGGMVGTTNLIARFEGIWDPKARSARQTRLARLHENDFNPPPVATVPRHLRPPAAPSSEPAAASAPSVERE